MTDNCARSLDLFMITSAKQAGIKVSFFVKNIVIDNTMSNLLFFYENGIRGQTI